MHSVNWYYVIMEVESKFFKRILSRTSCLTYLLMLFPTRSIGKHIIVYRCTRAHAICVYTVYACIYGTRKTAGQWFSWFPVGSRISFRNLTCFFPQLPLTSTITLNIWKSVLSIWSTSTRYSDVYPRGTPLYFR